MASNLKFPVLVIGAGPAGMAAAVAAASSGTRVGVVDDNPGPGGQIWRGEGRKPSSRQASRWFERIRSSSIDYLYGTQVLGPLERGTLLAETDSRATTLQYDRLIIATGARELFLPFPGWTLPNVLGAGGLQAMVKSGLPISGKSVVVAGSGPLLLAVAAYLKHSGADVRLVAEQAPLRKLARFGLGLWRDPAKIRQAAGLKWSLGSVRFKAGCWPVAAEGEGAVARVALTDGRTTWHERCDYLACGFGLVPNGELAMALGCATVRGFVGVDASQRTTVPDVFAAGELTGIGGVDLALVAGQIAGFTAAGDEVKARDLFASRERARAFAKRLDRAFSLRDELHTLAKTDTIVCRCEDVPHGALVPYRSWLDAKLQTRCGMGACQGRVCGGAVEVLYGWSRTSIRPPILPTALANLGRRAETDQSL
jgi:NADPH-dependent 2,4-dienoyl-CoA reductase/sulfur reductase-like enzyme